MQSLITWIVRKLLRHSTSDLASGSSSLGTSGFSAELASERESRMALWIFYGSDKCQKVAKITYISFMDLLWIFYGSFMALMTWKKPSGEERSTRHGELELAQRVLIFRNTINRACCHFS
ncbi:hypothetical protein QL285_094251 [Trifolium repens]|nr:hypothetical protein QL285_094251 [Trifolium repens]